MYVTYQITGANTKQIYIGYASASHDDLVAHFLTGARRNELTRGDVRWLDENDGDTDSVKAEVLDIFETEVEAWIDRNERRETESNSITGASAFPIPSHEAKEGDKVSQHIKWLNDREIASIPAIKHDFAEMGAGYLQRVAAVYGQLARAGRKTMTVGEFKAAFAVAMF